MKQKNQNPSLAARLSNPIRIANSASPASLALSTRSKLMRTAGLIVLASAAAHAAPLITPGDPVFAYDLDTAGGSTGSVTYLAVNYPANENPPKAVDGLPGTKYLNQAKHCAGIIVTANTAAVAQSLVLTTANDAIERDPSSYIILGSNQPITSADKSNGFADHWTYITQGSLSLPTTRGTTASAITFANTKSFKSFWIVFPTTRDNVGNNLMQIAEIQLFTGTGGTGTGIFAPGNPALATGWNSSIANGEFVSRVVDGNGTTKYLNFGENNSGFFVVPSTGKSIATSFQLTTANDSDVRDPATWTLHGQDVNGLWSQLASGSVTLPATRGALGPVVTFTNTTPCVAYRMTFPTVKNATSANSMQVAECQLFGTILPANDTDNDFMDDAWETTYGLNVGTNDGADDPDSDTSSNLQEYQRGTIPTNPDTDADGLLDGYETDTGTYVSATSTGSNPINPDTDGDSYGDGYEVTHGTNPVQSGSIPTITWDITPGIAGAGDSAITGGTGTWDNLTTANWSTDNGANNITWDNAGQRKSAIFGGTAGTVTLSGGIDADRLTVNTDAYIFSGDTLTLGSTTPMITVATGTTTISNVIAGTTGFTKQGNGVLRLTGSASNTFTGTTNLKGIGKIVLAKDPGQIALPGDVFLDSFSFTANNSGLVLAGDEQIADTGVVSYANIGQADTYFRLNGHKETIGGLVSTGVGGFVNVENRGSGDVVDYVPGELVIKTTGANSYSYNGNIRDIDGGTLGQNRVMITKDGTGTQTLSGNNSYTGATKVLGGTLVLGSNLAGSAVTVETGGTLSGVTTLGQALTINAGGTIAPGINGIGTIAAPTTTLAGGAYAAQVNATAGDRLTVTGDLDITGAALNITTLATPTAPSYILASATGTITGTFSVTGLPSGYQLKYDNGAGQIRLVRDGYSAFATANGLPADDTVDTDNDGLANGIEYVLGTNPNAASGGAPVPAVVGANFTFTFQRLRANMTEDISVDIELGTDLENLNTLFHVGADTATSSGGVTVTPNGAYDTVVLSVPRAPDAQKFARLTVTVTPP